MASLVRGAVQKPLGPALVAVGVILLAFGHIMVGITRLDIALLLPEVMHGIGVTTLAAGGLISTLTVLGDGVSEPFLGRLSDIIGRRTTLAAGIGLFSLATVLTGLVRSLDSMVVVRILLGVGQGMFLPAWFAFLGGRFSRRRGLAIGSLGGMFTVGAALNPLITRGVYNASGHSWPEPFIVTGIFGLVLAAAVLVVGRTGLFESVLGAGREAAPRAPATRAAQRAPRADDAGTQRPSGLFEKNMLLLLVAIIFWGLTQYGYLGLFVTYLRIHQHFPLGEAALVASIAGWTSFAFSFIGGWLSDHLGRRYTLILFAVLGAVFAYPVFVFSTSFWPAVILAAIFEASNGMIYVLSVAYAQDLAGAGNLGGHTGAVSGVGHVVAGFAGLVVGAIAQSMGFTMVGWAFALASVIIIVAVYFTTDPRRVALASTRPSARPSAQPAARP